jgi:hypothetical protein
MVAHQFLGLLATALLPFASADCPTGSIGVGVSNPLDVGKISWIFVLSADT